MSSFVNNNTVSVPIYKKYINKKASFTGIRGIELVLDIIRTSFVARSNKYERLFKNPNKFKDDYKIVF